MKPHLRVCGRTFLVSVALLSCITLPDASAQGPGWMPPNADMFEKEGKIVATFPNSIQMETVRGAKWVIQVMPQQCQLKITGAADPAFLHTGLHIKFSGEIDDKGVLQSELKEIEIFTPNGKHSVGVFPTGSDEKSKPVPRPAAGNYDFRGRVLSYRDGELVVLAGKKLTGKVASDAELAVNVQDLSFAQRDDELTVKGWTTRAMGPNYPKNLPGTAVAREIEIKLGKRLTAPPAKGAQRGGKLPKGKQPQNDPVNSEDPFGLNDIGKKTEKQDGKKEAAE